MPRNKDLKRVVRARMQKTGEAYTAARAQVLRKKREQQIPPSAPSAPSARIRAGSSARIRADGSTPDDAAQSPISDRYAELAGMSDAAVKAKTGCGWERWVRSLDHHGAMSLSHAEIAKLLRTEFKTSSWWTQTIAVGYERIKGLRARGQQRNGTFGATKSKTYNVPVDVLFDAWADAATRRRWLAESGVRIRTSTRPKSIRLAWPGGAIIAVGFTAKGAGKSAVALEHSKLPDRESADRVKREWSDRLNALAKVLAAT